MPSTTPTEALAVLTGALCVFLLVRESVWNWPAGLATSVFYFMLFYSTRLFADMSLQAVFFAINVYGWWHWIHGGTEAKPLPITRMRTPEWVAAGVAIPILTIGARYVLVSVGDAAPLQDGFTTILSLVASYLQTLKRIEHWWFWITADLFYIPMYLGRHLPLTALLYGGFLALCIAGLVQWERSMTRAQIAT